MPGVGRKKGVAHGVLTVLAPTPGTFFAFTYGDIDGTTLVASIYNRDHWQSDRATTSDYPSSGAPSIGILSDSGAAVGNGSLCWWGSLPAKVRVWDPESNTVYTYDGDSARSIAGVGYAGGRLYWLEWQSTEIGGVWTENGSTLAVRLVSAKCDLTDVTVVVSHDVDLSYVTTQPPKIADVSGFVISDAAVAAHVEASIFEIGGTYDFDVSISLGGSVATSPPVGLIADPGEHGTAPGTVGISGGTVSVYGPGGTLNSRGNGDAASTATLWPSGGSSCLSRADAKLGSFTGTMYLGTLSGGPTDNFDPEVHPTLGFSPILFYGT